MPASCAGIVLMRQMPGDAGVVFITLSDEAGIANVVVWPKLVETFRREIMGGRLLLVEGKVQRSPEGVVHLVAERIFDRSQELGRLSEDVTEAPSFRAAGRQAPPPPQCPHRAEIAGFSLARFASIIGNAPPYSVFCHMHVHAKYGAQRFVVERPRHHVIGDNAALMHDDNAVRIGRGEIQIMQNDKSPELRRKQLAHRRENVDLVLDIQIGNRFIKEQEFRLVRLAAF